MKEQVSEYEFKSLFEKANQRSDQVADFKFHEFKQSEVYDLEEKNNMLRIERNDALKNSFSIAPVVKEHRGINKQEHEEREQIIEEEITKRLKKIQRQAYDEGRAEGIKAGKEEIFQQMSHECEQKLELFTEMIRNVLTTQSELIQKEKLAVYRTIRNLTKWIIIGELKQDEGYIARLLEKLIEELQVKNNLLVKVDPNSFETMPEILEQVEKTLGKLDQVRVEQDYDIAGPGIIIDSDNGIINGTLKEQFASLDALFAKVGIESEPEENEGLFKSLSINEESSSHEILNTESEGPIHVESEASSEENQESSELDLSDEGEELDHSDDEDKGEDDS